MSFSTRPFPLHFFVLAAFLVAVATAGAFRVQTPPGFDKWTPQQQADYINPLMANAADEQKKAARQRQDAIDAQASQAGQQAQAAAEERRAEILADEAHGKSGTATANPGAGADAETPTEIPETSIFVYLILVALVAWGARLFIRRASEIRQLREMDLPRETKTP